MQSTAAIAQERARDLIACAVACFLFLHAWAPFLPSSGKLSLPESAPGAAISISGQFCDGDAHHGNDAPSQEHRQHCVLCSVGARDIALYAAALIVTIVYLVLPRFEAGPLRARRGDDAAPPPIGWISSWSSRAPPSFS